MSVLLTLALNTPTPLVLLTALVSATLVVLGALDLIAIEREQARREAAEAAALPAIAQSFERFLQLRMTQFTARQAALEGAGDDLTGNTLIW